jgi:hypothetical protein
MPLRTSDNTDHPLSLYGATKKANELMAHAYGSLFGLPAAEKYMPQLQHNMWVVAAPNVTSVVKSSSPG